MSNRKSPEVRAFFIASELLHIALSSHIFQKGLLEAEIFLPWTAQDLRGEIYSNCQVLGERSEEEGAYFQIRGEPNVVNGLREQLSQVKQ